MALPGMGGDDYIDPEVLRRRLAAQQTPLQGVEADANQNLVAPGTGAVGSPMGGGSGSLTGQDAQLMQRTMGGGGGSEQGREDLRQTALRGFDVNAELERINREQAARLVSTREQRYDQSQSGDRGGTPGTYQPTGQQTPAAQANAPQTPKPDFFAPERDILAPALRGASEVAGLASGAGALATGIKHIAKGVATGAAGNIARGGSSIADDVASGVANIRGRVPMSGRGAETAAADRLRLAALRVAGTAGSGAAGAATKAAQTAAGVGDDAGRAGSGVLAAAARWLSQAPVIRAAAKNPGPVIAGGIGGAVADEALGRPVGESLETAPDDVDPTTAVAPSIIDQYMQAGGNKQQTTTNTETGTAPATTTVPGTTPPATTTVPGFVPPRTTTPPGPTPPGTTTPPGPTPPGVVTPPKVEPPKVEPPKVEPPKGRVDPIIEGRGFTGPTLAPTISSRSGALDEVSKGVMADLNQLSEMVRNPKATPDVIGMYQRGLGELLKMIDQQEAQLRADSEREGTQMDPATMFHLGELRKQLDEQLRANREVMNSRGLYDSGVALETETKLRTQSLTEQGRLTAEHMAKMKQNLFAGLDSLRQKRIGAATDFTFAGIGGQLTADENSESRRADLMKQIVQSRLGLRGQLSGEHDNELSREVTVQEGNADRSSREAINRYEQEQQNARSQADRDAAWQRLVEEIGFEKAKHQEELAAGKYDAQGGGNAAATNAAIAHLQTLQTREEALQQLNEAMRDLVNSGANITRIIQFINQRFQ